MAMSEDYRRFRLIDEGDEVREFTDGEEFKVILAEMIVKNDRVELAFWEEEGRELVVRVLYSRLLAEH
jgi:hypothetical protein